jgi:hypothetical protein
MSRAKRSAAAVTVIILLKRREKCKKIKCWLQSGLQEEKKKGQTENYKEN